jgi:hypothetical protein
MASSIAAHLAEDEAMAKAAALSGEIFGIGRQYAPEWTTRDPSGWEPDEDERQPSYVRSDAGMVVFDEGSPTPDQAEHIARNDPARVLRRVKATRELVAAILAEPHDWIPGDEWYSCSQAEDPDPAPGEGGPGSGCHDPDRAGDPCDCGRDQRVARLLGIIAGEWEGT